MILNVVHLNTIGSTVKDLLSEVDATFHYAKLSSINTNYILGKSYTPP